MGFEPAPVQPHYLGTASCNLPETEGGHNVAMDEILLPTTAGIRETPRTKDGTAGAALSRM